MNPFAPRGTISREELLAYAEGRLAPERRQEVELHLEADPLLAEAMDGLRGNTAMAAALDKHRPRGTASKAWWFLGAGAVVVLLLFFVRDGPKEAQPEATSAMVEAPLPDDASQAKAMDSLVEEIAMAEERPESLHIGHESSALHRREVAVERVVRDSIARLQPLDAPGHRVDNARDPRPAHKARTSRQLIFLHDLKLVHPKELYADDPVMRLADAGVLARYADGSEQGRARGDALMLPYTSFMDDAIGRFAAGDHKGALDDLRFVLVQYPDDVNALFYAGLCAYNLGLYDRARRLLHRAAIHPVDVFDEEAAWYHALALERLGERAEAQDAFRRIAGAKGFYAGAARERLGARAE